jgi:hypothetical protein
VNAQQSSEGFLEHKQFEVADAFSDDGEHFVSRADEKLTAFLELERQVLPVMLSLASIRADPCDDQ